MNLISWPFSFLAIICTDKWDLDNLTDYIITTHHSYAKKNSVVIYDLAQEVANQHGEKHPVVSVLQLQRLQHVNPGLKTTTHPGNSYYLLFFLRAKLKYVVLISTQVFASLRSVVIAVVILINIPIVLVSYIGNLDLLWLLLVTVPLLALAIYKINRKRYPAVNKYFLGQKLNAILANYEWLTHSDPNIKITKNDLSITIGNDKCTQPYRTSIYNIRVKDSLKKGVVQKIIRELPANDKRALTEDIITHDLIGGEKILQIGPEYAGCQTERGGFDAIKFKQNACRDSVKMVELNLSSEHSDIVNDSLNLSTLGFTVFSDA